MKDWTPDQISQFLIGITAVIGAIAALIRSIHGNNNSVPKETVSKMLDQKTTTTDSNNTIVESENPATAVAALSGKE